MNIPSRRAALLTLTVGLSLAAPARPDIRPVSAKEDVSRLPAAAAQPGRSDPANPVGWVESSRPTRPRAVTRALRRGSLCHSRQERTRRAKKRRPTLTTLSVTLSAT